MTTVTPTVRGVTKPKPTARQIRRGRAIAAAKRKADADFDAWLLEMDEHGAALRAIAEVVEVDHTIIARAIKRLRGDR